jgi:acyl-CoA thioester hydrolase
VAAKDAVLSPLLQGRGPGEGALPPHEHRARVYFADTDAGGVMYHAAYLAFAEAARTEFLRAAGLPHALMLAEHGTMFMVRRVNMLYLRPARLDDLVRVTTEPVCHSAATIRLLQTFYVDGKIGELDVTLVCVKLQTGQPARIPPRWRAMLAQSGGPAVGP